jgi:hypothetical protein
LRKPYSEEVPYFARNFNVVVFVVEGLVTADAPWERRVNPERLAMALREAEVIVSLHALGMRDTLSLAKSIGEYASTAASQVTDALDELELAWAIETDLSPRAGLREVVLHLQACGKSVLFASAMGERVAKQVVKSGLRVSGLPVFGRSKPGTFAETLQGALQRAFDSAQPGDRCLVITHHGLGQQPVNSNSELLTLGRGEPIGGIEGLDVIDLAAQCALTEAERQDITRRVKKRDRARELKNTQSLTSEELAEYFDLTGGGRVIGNSAQSGYVDEKKGIENTNLMRHIRNDAADRQHLLEVISIDAALIEVELRNWLIVHHDYSFAAKERLTFGQTVGLAADRGFPASLIGRLNLFNRRRNDAVHHLSMGVDSYHQMTDDYMADCSLLFDVQDFVLDSAPVVGRGADNY